MSKISKEIVKSEQEARRLLKSRGATDISKECVGRCGCGQTWALHGSIRKKDYNSPFLKVSGHKYIWNMMPVGDIAICDKCGEDS